MMVTLAVILIILGQARVVLGSVGTMALALVLMFVVGYSSGLIAWGILFALRRAGVHRLAEAQTWPQK
jgi:hypothetical protein